MSACSPGSWRRLRRPGGSSYWPGRISGGEPGWQGSVTGWLVGQCYRLDARAVLQARRQGSVTGWMAGKCYRLAAWAVLQADWQGIVTGQIMHNTHKKEIYPVIDIIIHGSWMKSFYCQKTSEPFPYFVTNFCYTSAAL